MGVGVLGRLGVAQRVIVVISLGLALLAVGVYVSTLGLQGSGIGGGVEKAILLSPSEPFTPPMVFHQVGPDLIPWQRLLVWLGLILAWAILSVVVLRPLRPTASEAETGK